MYAQMLCGLCHRHAVLCIRAVSFLQRNWGHLADDIEAGALIGQHIHHRRGHNIDRWYPIGTYRLSSYRQIPYRRYSYR
jgi:hypothetical protein